MHHEEIERRKDRIRLYRTKLIWFDSLDSTGSIIFAAALKKIFSRFLYRTLFSMPVYLLPNYNPEV